MTMTWVRISLAVTIGATAFVVAFVLGTPLNLAIGPAMGGLLNSVFTAIIITIGCRILERFPYAAIMWIAFSIPAVVTTTMGPPGIHKPAVAAVTGLVMELSFWIFGRKAWSYFVVGFLTSAVMTACILLAMLLLGLSPDAAAGLAKRLWFVLPIYGVLGGLGMYVGYGVFEARFRDLDIVERVRVGGSE